MFVEGGKSDKNQDIHLVTQSHLKVVNEQDVEENEDNMPKQLRPRHQTELADQDFQDSQE